MDLSGLEWILLLAFGFFSLVGLAVLVLVVVVAVRYRSMLPSTLALLGALVYGALPVDLLPEAFLGPLGLADDVGVLGLAVAFLVTQLRRRRSQAASPGAGAPGRVGVAGDHRGSDDDITVRQLPDD